jgi:hypothetical protein
VAGCTLPSSVEGPSEPPGWGVAAGSVGQIPRVAAPASADGLVLVALGEAWTDRAGMEALAGRRVVGRSRVGNPAGQQIQGRARIDSARQEVGPADPLALDPAGLAVVEKAVYRSAASLAQGPVVRGSDGSLWRSQFNGRRNFTWVKSWFRSNETFTSLKS